MCTILFSMCNPTTPTVPLLPHNLMTPHAPQSLFLHLAEAPCRTCGAAPPSSPALCLLTGAPLCALWRGCEGGRGGGLLHAREACAGTCLLLSLRTTRVMALRDSRLAVCQSPYLDAHGGWFMGGIALHNPIIPSCMIPCTTHSFVPVALPGCARWVVGTPHSDSWPGWLSGRPCPDDSLPIPPTRGPHDNLN